MLRHLAVILQRFFARGLLMRGGEGEIADLEQFGRGEERHVRGIVEDGINQASLINNDGLEPGALRLDSAGQASGTGADDEHIHARSGVCVKLRPRQSVGNLLRRFRHLFGAHGGLWRVNDSSMHLMGGRDAGQ